MAYEGLKINMYPRRYAAIVHNSKGINSGQYLWPKLYLYITHIISFPIISNPKAILKVLIHLAFLFLFIVYGKNKNRKKDIKRTAKWLLEKVINGLSPGRFTLKNYLYWILL